MEKYDIDIGLTQHLYRQDSKTGVIVNQLNPFRFGTIEVDNFPFDISECTTPENNTRYPYHRHIKMYYAHTPYTCYV